MPRLFVEQLTVIDCALLDAARGLVGESWIVDVELEGALDHQGMVLDFGEAKKRLKKAIDDAVDHRLLVPGAAPELQFSKSGDRCGLTFRAATGVIEHQSPVKAVAVLDAPGVDAATLAAHLQPALRKVVPESVREIRLRLRTESIEGPFYQYTHGLKKHDGHCQRIAHGHRSRLQIYVNGRRDERLERRRAELWRDIYLGTSSDIAEHSGDRLRFAYRSSEGEFELELPADRCDLLPVDTTVERIAEHLAAEVALERRGMKVEIRAYEGVMKGAVATSGG